MTVRVFVTSGLIKIIYYLFDTWHDASHRPMEERWGMERGGGEKRGKSGRSNTICTDTVNTEND